MKKFAVRTSSRKELVDITGRIQDCVRESGVENGLGVVFVPHTTCGLALNENADPSVKADITARLAVLAPENAGYRHSEGNSDAHILSSLTGQSLTLFVEKGTLLLGTWQGVFLCEFDGPRERTVWVKIRKD